MAFPTQTLLTAVYNRLDAELSEDVFVRGAADPDAQAPYLLIERPRLEGESTLDGKALHTIRLSIRAHTRFEQSRASTDSIRLARDVHAALKSAEIQLDGFRNPYVPEPDVRPVQYEIGGKQAYDRILQYEVRI